MINKRNIIVNVKVNITVQRFEKEKGRAKERKGESERKNKGRALTLDGLNVTGPLIYMYAK
jgi:hypothetical protein